MSALFETARPFRFEDLNGKPEPESWGPCYPKTASAAVEKWRRLARVRELTPQEKREHGQAVGAWIRALNNPAAKRHEIPASDLHYPRLFTCEKLRGQIRAAFAAQANADKREWASGKLESKSVGHSGLTLRQAYALAMDEKRARLALEAAAQPVLEAA
jgi:hypothetical protein